MNKVCFAAGTALGVLALIVIGIAEEIESRRFARARAHSPQRRGVSSPSWV